MEKQQVFREKSLERISSPEQLHDYMRVTSPKLWMILTAVIVLIGGFIVAACTFTLENSLNVQVVVTEGKDETPSIVFSLPLNEKESIDVGMEVRFGSYTGQIDSLYQDAQNVNAKVVLEKDSETPAAGTYDGQVVIEKVTPISFLLN